MSSSMKEQCPACRKPIEPRPSLFSCQAIECQQCGASLQTNIRSRLLYILSFGLLAAYHLFIRSVGDQASDVVVWGGLSVVLVPLIITVFTTRYEAGRQRGGYSLFVNAVFFLMVLLLLVLWLYSS